MDIISKDRTSSVYDYAEEIYKLQEHAEKKYGRRLTKDEFLMLSFIVMQEHEKE